MCFTDILLSADKDGSDSTKYFTGRYGIQNFSNDFILVNCLSNAGRAIPALFSEHSFKYFDFYRFLHYIVCYPCMCNLHSLHEVLNELVISMTSSLAWLYSVYAKTRLEYFNSSLYH